MGNDEAYNTAPCGVSMLCVAIREDTREELGEEYADALYNKYRQLSSNEAYDAIKEYCH
jgi:hypothetical protein